MGQVTSPKEESIAHKHKKYGLTLWVTGNMQVKMRYCIATRLARTSSGRDGVVPSWMDPLENRPPTAWFHSPKSGGSLQTCARKCGRNVVSPPFCLPLPALCAPVTEPDSRNSPHVHQHDAEHMAGHPWVGALPSCEKEKTSAMLSSKVSQHSVQPQGKFK